MMSCTWQAQLRLLFSKSFWPDIRCDCKALTNPGLLFTLVFTSAACRELAEVRRVPKAT